jgi:hypothetical protein
MEESSLTTACPRPFGPLFCLLWQLWKFDCYRG